MDKRTEFNNALKAAMKARDEVATGTLRLILAALKDRDIAARGQGTDGGIGEKDILSLLQSMIKQRQESLETYRKAGREDLAGREEAEIVIIRKFLPQQMDDAAIGATVDALIKELGVTSVRDMGKVMAELKARYTGQLDMAKASGAIKERLAS